jgi:hypothetical protein
MTSGRDGLDLALSNMTCMPVMMCQLVRQQEQQQRQAGHLRVCSIAAGVDVGRRHGVRRLHRLVCGAPLGPQLLCERLIAGLICERGLWKQATNAYVPAQTSWTRARRHTADEHRKPWHFRCCNVR